MFAKHRSVTADDAGIGGLDTDAGEAAHLAGQGGNGVLRSVQGNGDDADSPLTVGQAHAADDVFTVIMEESIDLFHHIRIFHNDAHNGDSGFHRVPPDVIGFYCHHIKENPPCPALFFRFSAYDNDYESEIIDKKISVILCGIRGKSLLFVRIK